MKEILAFKNCKLNFWFAKVFRYMDFNFHETVNRAMTFQDSELIFFVSPSETEAPTLIRQISIQNKVRIKKTTKSFILKTLNYPQPTSRNKLSLPTFVAKRLLRCSLYTRDLVLTSCASPINIFEITSTTPNWPGTTLQWRPLWGNFIKKRKMLFAFDYSPHQFQASFSQTTTTTK